MEWDKETDYLFCDNSFYDIAKGCDIGLGFIYDLEINKIIIDEYSNFHSSTPYRYNILINVSGEWEYEVFNEDTQRWEFGDPKIENEWIKMEFVLNRWERNPEDIFYLMRHYNEFLDMNIHWSNHECYYIEALDNVNEELSKKAYEYLCDYAQAVYEYEHDL